MQRAKRIKSRIEDLAYGEPVYWMTLLGSVVVIIGGIIAFVTRSNFVSTSYWISAVWKGESSEQIWEGAGTSVPEGHWYLSHLTTGDGLQALGISIALLGISVGLALTGIVLFKRKNAVFGVFALIAATVITLAVFGY
ncbi:hypothetical protein ACFLXE_08945 [Chloroflexota bacterium]